MGDSAKGYIHFSSSIFISFLPYTPSLNFKVLVGFKETWFRLVCKITVYEETLFINVIFIFHFYSKRM